MPASPEKLDLASLDVAADKRRLLRQLFPEAFTESTGTDGKLAELDFEKLKAVLGEHVELATPGLERYGLNGRENGMRSRRCKLRPSPRSSRLRRNPPLQIPTHAASDPAYHLNGVSVSLARDGRGSDRHGELRPQAIPRCKSLMRAHQ